MALDHEDYLPGETPAAHATTHESGGTDEITVAGLSGVTAELAAHAALAAAHHDKYTDAEASVIATGLIAVHAAIAGAHHARYTDAEVTAIANALIATHKADATAHQDAPALIATHKADATAHQDAPALIATHKADAIAHQDAPALIATHKAIAAAHHAKYTNAEAVAAVYAGKQCFNAYLTSILTNVTGDDTSYNITGAVWTELVDQGANFSNGTFTAPDTGTYLFSGAIGLDGILASHTYGYSVLVSSNRTYFIFSANPATMAGAGSLYLPFCFYSDMDEDDTAFLRIRIYNGTKVVDITSATFFGGSRVI